MKSYVTPEISVNPASALVDEEISIKIHGLLPHQNVTLYAMSCPDGLSEFYSYAHYTASENGTIYVTEEPSMGGMYIGLHPMGLFWSMVESPNNSKKKIRFFVKDVTSPLEARLEIHDFHLSYDDLSTSSALAVTVVKRWYKHPNVIRRPVKVGNLRGTLFIPDGAGPFPAIIDTFGGGGGLREFRSALLASRGFLSLALAYFAYDDLPKKLTHFDLEYIEEAKDYLLSLPFVLQVGVGLITISAGVPIALAATTCIPDIRCCIAINGPVFCHYHTISYKGRYWVPSLCNERGFAIMDNTYVLRYSASKCYPIPPKSLIEFYKTSSAFLFIYCGEDMSVDPTQNIKTIEQYCQVSGCNYRIIYFPGAGHLLEPPYSPLSTETYANKLQMSLKWGGKPMEHAAAQFSAWQETLSFFTKHLKQWQSRL